MIKKKILIVVYLVMTTFLLFIGVVNACTEQYNSVDGNEIRWGGYTKYLSSWNNAVDIWNDLDPINILPDTWLTWEDVTLSDYYDNNTNIVAEYNHWLGTIKFNKYKMDGFSYNNNRTNAAAHELGHALGLAHTAYPINNNFLNIMYEYNQTRITLGNHDIFSYNQLWN